MMAAFFLSFMTGVFSVLFKAVDAARRPQAAIAHPSRIFLLSNPNKAAKIRAARAGELE